MIQFYNPKIEVDSILPADEGAHAIRVLRKKEGDIVMVTDGVGHRFACRLLSTNYRVIPVEILSKEDVPKTWNNRITIAVAPTKHLDRMEWFVEKAVEIGVDRIVLLGCRHSERRIMKIDRLKKIMVSAMKQSLKTVLPEITELMPLSEFLGTVAEGDLKYLGYCDSNYPLKSFVNEYRHGSDVTILIGPEGDFSQAEVSDAVAAGFVPVTFGDTRLRTETAALYGVQSVHIINQMSNL